LRKKYKHKLREERNNGKLRIKRFYLPQEHKNTIQRILRYLLMEIVFLFKVAGLKFDVLYLGSTPPIHGFFGAIIKKIKKVRFIYKIQDVFPESLVHTGMTKKGSITWKLGSVLSEFTYKNADRIIVISEGFKENLISKGVEEQKIDVIRNWVEEESVISIDRADNKLFDKYNLDRSKFYITYCGNIGFTQSLDMLIDAAKELENYQDICFVLVGDGVYKKEVKKQLMLKKMNNVVLLPFQPYEDISHVFSLGDVSLVLSKANVSENSVPSKTWSIMSAQRPIIAAFDLDSELSRIISKSDCGICVRAENKDEFKHAIFKLYRSRSDCVRMGSNGRKYILDHLTKDTGKTQYTKLLKSLELHKESSDYEERR
jgi:glycosyltransferase involved in cell wall biosynthesis